MTTSGTGQCGLSALAPVNLLSNTRNLSLANPQRNKTMNLPKISSYGQYASNNYGAHCLVVTMLNVRVWFSYQTPIAFQVDGKPRVVRKNEWGPTTGKHLNQIDGGTNEARKARVSGSQFEQLFSEQVS